MVKIADALEIEVYQLFVPQYRAAPVIDDTPENEKIRHQMRTQLVSDFRKSMTKMLDKWESK